MNCEVRGMELERKKSMLMIIWYKEALKRVIRIVSYEKGTIVPKKGSSLNCITDGSPPFP
jgi:hypothetical protein